MQLPVRLETPDSVSNYVLAFSGGLDSSVLLHWLVNNGIPFRAIHVNHQLQGQASDWVEHCAAVCTQYACPFESINVTVNGRKDVGPEAAARQSRYEALFAALDEGEVLMTAHHADDQAETVLLHLIRGSGPAGLSGIPAFSRNRLFRPLLNISRKDLNEYARHHGIKWIDDPTNQDVALSRNYLRHRIMPMLEARWPAYRQTLARSADLQAEATELLNELANQDLDTASLGMPGIFSIKALMRLSSARRKNALRYACQELGLAPPHAVHLDKIEGDLLSSRADANPCVAWADVQVRRYRDLLFLMAELPPSPNEACIDWSLGKPLQLPPGCGELRACRAQDAGLETEIQVLRVCFNTIGERIRLHKSSNHKKLKNLYQEGSVPPWVRERVPLIYHGDDLVAVADRWTSADFAAGDQHQGWQFYWHNPPVGWRLPGTESDQYFVKIPSGG